MMLLGIVVEAKVANVESRHLFTHLRLGIWYQSMRRFSFLVFSFLFSQAHGAEELGPPYLAHAGVGRAAKLHSGPYYAVKRTSETNFQDAGTEPGYRQRGCTIKRLSHDVI